jgi:phytoene/squalene synthetase
MSLDACAGLVRRGDPDRFLSAMTAAPALRGRLMTLYAFNLEVARAPWVASEPMLAEMRLQWWADAIAGIFDGTAPRRHEVVTPLAALIAETGLPRAPFEVLIEARRADAYPAPHADVRAYLDATSGGLVVLAAQALGADGADCAAARQAGFAFGAAGLLAARADLEARGRPPFPPGTDRAALAAEAQAALRTARRTRIPPPARAALRAGWLAPGILAQVRAAPQTPPRPPSEFRRRLGLLALTLARRW